MKLEQAAFLARLKKYFQQHPHTPIMEALAKLNVVDRFETKHTKYKGKPIVLYQSDDSVTDEELLKKMNKHA